VANLKKQALSHVYYLAERGHSVLNSVDVNREPQNWGVLGLRPLWMGGATPRNTPLPMYMYYLA